MCTLCTAVKSIFVVDFVPYVVGLIQRDAQSMVAVILQALVGCYGMSLLLGMIGLVQWRAYILLRRGPCWEWDSAALRNIVQ